MGGRDFLDLDSFLFRKKNSNNASNIFGDQTPDSITFDPVVPIRDERLSGELAFGSAMVGVLHDNWLIGQSAHPAGTLPTAQSSGKRLGTTAVKWTRLSCHSFEANAVRLQLHALACNLGNFMRTLAAPEPIRHWSLTSLREKLIKIGAKVVSHARYVAFQMAEVAIPGSLFAAILRMIAKLRPPPDPAPA